MTTLLYGLYWDPRYNKAPTNSRASAVQGTCVLIGQPTLTKMEAVNRAICKVPSSEGSAPECVPAHSSWDLDPGHSDPAADRALTGSHQRCGHMACYEGEGTRVSLGTNRSVAFVRLQELWAEGWLDGRARAVLIQFTLFHPPTGLFTTVSLLAEQLVRGGLLPSASIQSVRVYQTASPLHYTTMACELLFLSFTLLQLCFQICTMSQEGPLSYWRNSRNWLEITTVIVSLHLLCAPLRSDCGDHRPHAEGQLQGIRGSWCPVVLGAGDPLSPWDDGVPAPGEVGPRVSDEQSTVSLCDPAEAVSLQTPGASGGGRRPGDRLRERGEPPLPVQLPPLQQPDAVPPHRPHALRWRPPAEDPVHTEPAQ
ncbi:hypothetical protein AAFF_G00256140 [Aldrovandia affinis]|uniref:Polycystin domain-containing protein n=1 Tax=Aldrovandia affinis TaxID=143900 RepID=A0AAD7RCR2_9TELE|nr:hypothetical protein AAFF_G00256140 [Aldrovandia affinis]